MDWRQGIGLIGLLGFVACGPIQATTAIVRAEEEARTAKLIDADKAAPYEYTKAELMLRMAKERQGFSDFEASKTFADNATRYFAEAKENTPRNQRWKQIRDKAVHKPAAPVSVPGQGGRP
jgi:neutral trehalase